MQVFIGGCDRRAAEILGIILGAHSRCACVPTAPDSRRRACRSDGVVEVACRDGDHAPLAAAGRPPIAARFGVGLAQKFPAARFLHVIRDGRAVAASSLGRRRSGATVGRAAERWFETVGHGLVLESWAGPRRVLRIRCEELCRDTEATLREIGAFLGLEYEPAMLAAADGVWGREAGRVDSWERLLTPRQTEIIESVTGDLLAYLGYELRFGGRARPATLVERLGSTLAAVLSRR